MSAWVLPDYIADVLPREARHIEELRRGLLDTARRYGYELVMPPLLEHLESLLTGTGEALDLQTYKLVDQISGRMMGLRADTTQQVARLDAHLLNRPGVTRLCYCGSVLHTWPDRPHATREPLQFGAEIYGHAGLQADLEALELALHCLQGAGIHQVSVDLADVRIVRSLLAGVPVEASHLRQVHAALAAKDASELRALTRNFPATSRNGLQILLQLYGDVSVLDAAAQAFSDSPGIQAPLADLRALAAHVGAERVTVDLADLRGYAYYSGARFSIYAQGANDALVRGGRYDEVGAVFGRNRPAAGFSLDVKQLVLALPEPTLPSAIRAPWSQDPALNAQIAALRRQGETVVCILPGQACEADAFRCDRELVCTDGRWLVQTIESN
jgi:ATP phosphoribosyltransferase regulatory subunit